jgi:tetratricopeptide (TPR) repeat protein
MKTSNEDSIKEISRKWDENVCTFVMVAPFLRGRTSMAKHIHATLLLVVLLCGSTWGQQVNPSANRLSLFSLTLAPRFTMPLGRDTAIYSYGGGGDIRAEYRFPGLPFIFVGGSLGYSYVSIQAPTSVSLIDVEPLVGFRYDLLPSLAARVFGSGGYFFASANDGSGTGSNPVLAAGASLSYGISQTLGIGVGATYRDYLGLYNDIALTIGMSYSFPVGGGQSAAPVQQAPVQTKPQPLQSTPPTRPETKGKGLVVKEIQLENVFPVQHAYYDSNPLGKITLLNSEDSPMTDIAVSFIVKQFMDAPKDCGAIAQLNPGEEKSVDLFALFKNTIFETKESTKVPAEIDITYTLGGKQQTTSKVETLRIYDRNALIWDDTNKAAAFVMPKEPAVLMMSNQINSFIKPRINRAIDANLQTGMALHDALRLLNIAYVSPPLTSYAVRSENKTAVDSVKFPLDTLQYHSGDCSDLSILYCSLLESVQIETAFITIPGHIFIAFALASSEADVKKTFAGWDEFIFRDNKVWVPVEVTERDGLFLKAWQEGAREWRENLLKKQADFYPVREAWKTYEPVNYPGMGGQSALPDQAQVVKDFDQDKMNLIMREISDKETELMAALIKSNNSPRSLNALGVLYARYDLSDKAEAQFRAAIKTAEYVPALANLGNLRFRDSKTDEALAFYQRAFKQAPHDPLVLLGLARANHELQNYGIVKTEYDELRTLNPVLADQFAYLRFQGEAATRAAESNNVAGVMVWEEEK